MTAHPDDDQEFYEPPPRYTSQDELGLLGSMLLEPERIPEVLRSVGSRDFGDLALRAAFNAIVDKHREADGDGSALAVLVMHSLRESPFVDSAQILLGEISAAVSTAAHSPTFAKAVCDAALKRRIVDIASEAAKAASNGQAGSEVLADLLADIESLQHNGGRNQIETITVGDLDANYPDMKPYVVDELFREGEVVNIVAAPKARKSWLVYGLALSIVNNERWLGRFDVAGGKVLIVDNELHRETLASRIRFVAKSMGIPLWSIRNDLLYWTLRDNIRSLQELEPEFSRFEPGELKAIIFDSKYRFASIDGKENASEDETKFYNMMNRIAAATNSACVLIHHTSKGNQSDKVATDVGSGSGAQSRACDTHLVIRPHEETDAIVLEAALRSFQPVDPLTLRWAAPLWIVDDGLDPAKVAGRLTKGEQTRVDRDVEDKRLILQKLAEEPEGLSVRAVRRATGFGQSKAVRLLDQLEANYLVQRYEGEASGNVCDMYQVPPGGVVQGGGTVSEPPPFPCTTGGVVGTPLKGSVPPTPPLRGTPKRTTPPIGHSEFHDYATGDAP